MAHGRRPVSQRPFGDLPSSTTRRGFPAGGRSFVIQLERERRRIEHVRRMCREHDIPLTPVAAVDGLALGEAELAELVAEGVVVAGFRRQIAPGHLGCALSHLLVWRRIAAAEHADALVVEDDFRPAPSFWPRFERFYRALPADWEIAYLNLWNRARFPTRPMAERPEVHVPSRILGTVGYLVSRRGVERILRHILPFGDCVDDELDRLYQAGRLRAYAAAENLVLHHDPFPSTLYQDGEARPFRWSQTRGEGVVAPGESGEASEGSPCIS